MLFGKYDPKMQLFFILNLKFEKEMIMKLVLNLILILVCLLYNFDWNLGKYALGLTCSSVVQQNKTHYIVEWHILLHCTLDEIVGPNIDFFQNLVINRVYVQNYFNS